jgi:hypothetical protein
MRSEHGDTTSAFRNPPSAPDYIPCYTIRSFEQLSLEDSRTSHAIIATGRLRDKLQRNGNADTL